MKGDLLTDKQTPNKKKKSTTTAKGLTSIQPNLGRAELRVKERFPLLRASPCLLSLCPFVFFLRCRGRVFFTLVFSPAPPTFTDTRT